jgi:multicomponent Na+:H+ antiporter subunit D
MVWALGLFALGSVVLGLAPQLAVNYIINPILPVLGMATVQVSWFGLTPAAGSWWTTGGLMLALVSAGAGIVFYVIAGSSRARVLAMGQGVVLAGATGGGDVGVFTGGEAIPEPSRLPASEFSVILKKQWAPFYQHTDVDRIYLGVWRALQAVSSAAGRVMAWAEKSILVWTVLLFGAVFAAVRGLPPVAANLAHGGVETLPPLLGLGCALALVALLMAASAQKVSRTLLPLLALSGVSAVAAAFVAQPIARLALLELASVLALALVWRTAPRRAVWIYGIVVALSAVSLIAGELSLQAGAVDWARPLLLAGFVLKLAIVPLLLWLPVVAAAAPVLVVGLIVAVVDIAAFGELYLVAQAHPEFLAPHAFWLAAALASSLLASLLMLTQRNMKRLLALSTIEDTGFLLLGVVAATQLGFRGALFAATVHAVAKALLFISLSAPEADEALTDDVRGLATRYPFSAAAFLAGMLAMLGVPPLLGFAGRWRLYQTAAEMNPWLLAGFILSSMFALIAYVLCLTRCWWGPSSQPDPAAESHQANPAESWPLRLAIVVLIVALLAGGLWPNMLLALAGGVQ